MKYLSKNQIARLKREARRRSQASTSSHLMILDEMARELGHSNWALLEKFQKAKEQLFPAFRRTPDEMQALMRRVKKPSGRFGMRLEEEDVRALIEPLHEKYANALSALAYARDFMKCLLQVKRFSIDGLSIAYSEMRVLLPYGLQRVSEGKYLIVGRDYTPVGMTEGKWVDYAEFTNLHLILRAEDFAQLGHEDYLFTDGSTPWVSRKHGESYLLRLEKLIEVVARKQTGRKPI